MSSILEEAKALEQEIIENRRYLHAHPECGFELENTSRFVIEKLTEYGYQPEMIYKSCIVATIGDASMGKTILLRADMDALPMFEETDLPFKSKIKAAHACGHDTHTSMLLGAAKLLKKHEAELKGCVKFMFQPDEEGLAPDGIGGADRMLEAGVLNNPKVDAAFSLHNFSGTYKSGVIAYRPGAFMSSCDTFIIQIFGKGAHGSQPDQAVSPINIAAHIYLGIQELVARELPSYGQGTITAGSFHSGDAPNILPDTAEIQGTIRMTDETLRKKIKERMEELCTHTAKAYGGSCKISFMHGIPSVYNNPELTSEIVGYSKELLGDCLYEEPYAFSGSDDFSSITQVVPSCYFLLGGGDAEEGYIYSHHNPHILFNESVLFKGTALFANTAIEWLKNH